MLPVIAIVGRPNVGKSTLFNALTRSSNALVADEAGLTRDRQYGIGKLAAHPHLLVDTGGMGGARDEISQLISAQAEHAVQESDAVVLVVDARDGLTAADQEVGLRLRRFGKPVLVAVNKTDGLEATTACTEFHTLGYHEAWPISAAHRRGLGPLLDAAVALLPAHAEGSVEDSSERIKVSVVGRPNVGKSTLVNRLTGESRVVAHALPGTTRDSVLVPFERGGSAYTLIDTAGIRRKARVDEKIEKFSVIKSLRSIADSHVVVLLIDAGTGVTDQDASLVGLIIEYGRALVIAVNKWDTLDRTQRREFKENLQRKLHFVDFAPARYISALHGSGLGELFSAIDRSWKSATAELHTPELTRLLREAVEQHPPPMVRGRRIKLRYAHQGGANPPLIVIHGNQTALLPAPYRRYLVNRFRSRLQLMGTPVLIELRTGGNPYKGRKNTLTPRQKRRRQRLMKHVKKKR